MPNIDKNLISTDIDWQSVIKKQGFKVIQIKTIRQGYAQLKIHEPSVNNQTIIDNYHYIMNDDEILKINKLKQPIDYEIVMENRIDIWWRNFVAKQMELILCKYPYNY